MDLVILLLSTENMQTWHDRNAFQLQNSTARCELIDMSH
jgi:hypothetical protein